MTTANLFPSSYFPPALYQQQQAREEMIFCDLPQSEYGLPTPPITPEDTDMSGTENIHPQFKPQFQQQTLSATTSPFTPSTSPKPSPITLPKRPNKRKSPADRDDNIPTRIHPHTSSSSFPKRPKLVQHNLTQPHDPRLDNKSNCMNCGRWFSTTGNLHNCIYHPGDWDRALTPAQCTDWKVGSWSCCMASLLGPGCRITRHRELDLGCTSLVKRTQIVSGHNSIVDQKMKQQSKFCLMYLGGSLGPKQDLDAL
ncbi:hypothetical protein OHC33_007111 [Knufia fluminis]|uniref:Uncharacterized protein n=2 Tax=Knufia TaxID=430999 RepID=A0AAN8EBW6_9EURO|nr:hypothetical protein OHC33_007111 [Knufia fluminis]